MFRRLISTEIKNIKKNSIINYKQKLFLVLGISHSKVARGGGLYKVELKDLNSGTKILERFNSGANVEETELTKNDYQFLYSDTEFHLVDSDFNEISIPKTMLQNHQKLEPFMDGLKLTVFFHNNTPVMCIPPERFVCKITETSAATGDSAKGMAFKEAFVGHAQIQVPEFIKVGDQVILDSATLKYVSRK